MYHDASGQRLTLARQHRNTANRDTAFRFVGKARSMCSTGRRQVRLRDFRRHAEDELARIATATTTSSRRIETGRRAQADDARLRLSFRARPLFPCRRVRSRPADRHRAESPSRRIDDDYKNPFRRTACGLSCARPG